MNNESAVRLRAFRAIEQTQSEYHTHIVIEDVGRALFRSLHLYQGSPAARKLVGDINEQDTYNALASLKNFIFYTETYPNHWPAGASVDAAIDIFNTRGRELRDWARQGIRPAWADEALSHTGQSAGASFVSIKDYDFQQISKEVWDFADGRRLEWRPLGLTPGGRRFDVLTFDGIDEVVIGPTGIEASVQKPGSR